MTTWLVLGSSVSAPAEYERAKPFADVVITSNRGLKIEPNPDWYWCSDNVAFDRYRVLIEAAICNGTKLLTNTIGVRASPPMGPMAHTIFNYPSGYDSNWQPGQYVNARASGGMSLQFAANQSPDTILMVGMEGYKSTPRLVVVEYFDGERGAGKCEKLMGTYGPLVQNVIDRSPSMKFFLFGKPQYPWRGMSIVEPGSTAELEPNDVRTPCANQGPSGATEAREISAELAD